MKRLVFAAAVAAASQLLVVSEASAWTCRASSATGSWGWGSAYNRGDAARRALYECSVRTPRGYTCYLRYCR